MTHPLEGKPLATRDFPRPLVVIVRFVREMLVMALPAGDYKRLVPRFAELDETAQMQGFQPVMPIEREIYFQVTLRADKFTSDGAWVRLGDTAGDEITGWQLARTLFVAKVLGELGADGKTVEPVVLAEAA